MTLPETIELVSRGGILALLILILFAGFKGWWVWGAESKRCLAEVERERLRGDRLEADLARLNQQVREQAIPALTEATAAVREATAMIRDEQAVAKWRRHFGTSEPS